MKNGILLCFFEPESLTLVASSANEVVTTWQTLKIAV